MGPGVVSYCCYFNRAVHLFELNRTCMYVYTVANLQLVSLSIINPSKNGKISVQLLELLLKILPLT